MPEGYWNLVTDDTGAVPVRLFLTEKLLVDAEPTLYRQIVNATRFPGTKLVAITPDVHYGYGVPVGCVILTDRHEGAIAMGPVGFDIGCGMMSARSNVDAGLATPDRKLAFNHAVSERVALGAGGKSVKLGTLDKRELQSLVRGGAEYYVDKYGAYLRPEPRRAASDSGLGRVGYSVGRQRQAGAGPLAARLARRWNSLHRASALRGDGHALRPGSHRESRLRARTGDELLPAREGRERRRADRSRSRVFPS